MPDPLDLDAIEARARSVISGNKWLTKITDEDIPALIARIRELEKFVADIGAELTSHDYCESDCSLQSDIQEYIDDLKTEPTDA